MYGVTGIISLNGRQIDRGSLKKCDFSDALFHGGNTCENLDPVRLTSSVDDISVCHRFYPMQIRVRTDSCAQQQRHCLTWGSERDAELHAEHRGVGDVPRAAGVHHVLNVRLNSYNFV